MKVEPVYVFGFALWYSLGFLWITAFQLAIHHHLGSKTTELERLIGFVAGWDAGWAIPVVLTITAATFGLRCPPWARVFNWPVNFMFNHPAATQLGTVAAIGLCEVAKYQKDSRWGVLAVAAVSSFAYMVFLFRTAAEGGKGTAMVVSSACGQNAVSILANPNLPIKGPFKFVVLGAYVVTAIFCVIYLLLNPEQPAIRVEAAEARDGARGEGRAESPN